MFFFKEKREGLNPGSSRTCFQLSSKFQMRFMGNLIWLVKNSRFLRLRKRYWAVGIPSLLLVMVLGYGLIEYSLGELFPSYPSHYFSRHPHWNHEWVLPTAGQPANGSRVFPSYSISTSGVFKQRNFSSEELQSLLTWDHMNGTVFGMERVPRAFEAVVEGRDVWQRLMDSIGDGRSLNDSSEEKGEQCPYSLSKMNSSDFTGREFRLSIPCGFVEGSSVTLIGTPGERTGEFTIDLVGAGFPREKDPPIILHYDVRLHGDKVTGDPVIIQNAWTADGGWGTEERCPPPKNGNSKQVDDLEQCNAMVGKDSFHKITTRRNKSDTGRYFPFRQGQLAIVTLWIGMEGIQMTVDGKHITAFAYRDKLKPWLVNEVTVSGDIQLISVVVNGLPTAEYTDKIIDLDALKSPSFAMHKPLSLFIGIFSTANHFKRRMAVRRTWMQYPTFKSGEVAARFFVGLHKNQMVNTELWHEALTYGDIQFMPFVDYYNLITWKTVAICIYGTDIVSARYVMKTDDDSFVRIDEVLSSLKKKNVNHGLFYGLITFDDQPHRDPDSKWFISLEDWPYDRYPPWAHGPGYIVSHDIAETICQMQKRGSLWMFKLEDVAMGIWIAQMKKNGAEITYENEERIYLDGCKTGFMIAHYQAPRDMLCLWLKLNESDGCCSQR